MANVIEVIVRAQNKLSGEFSKMGKDVGKFNKSIMAIGAVSGVAFAASTLAIRKMVKETAELGDLFAKTEARTGIAADTLSQLHFVAERTGSSFQTLVKGFKQLAQTAYDAERGMTAYSDIYDDLEVSVTAAGGQLKDMKTLLFDVADALSKEENATTKSAIATKLFGRAGQDLIPILVAGREGFRGLMEEADALGATMSREDALRWEGFVDAMTNLSAASRGLKLQLSGALAPAIQAMAEVLTKATAGLGKFMREHEDLTKAIGILVIAITGGAGLIAAFTAIVAIAPAVGTALAVMTGGVSLATTAIVALAATGWMLRKQLAADFVEAAEDILWAVQKLLEGVGALLEYFGADWLDGAIASIKNARISLRGTIDDLRGIKEEADNAADALDGVGDAGAGGEPAPWAGAGPADIRDAGSGTQMEAAMNLAKALDITAEKSLTFFGKLLPEAIDTTNNALTEAQEVLLEMGLTGEQVANDISYAFGDAFARGIMDAERMGATLERAFRAWANAAIAEITRVMAKMAIMAAMNYLTGGWASFLPSGGSGLEPAGNSGWGDTLASGGRSGGTVGSGPGGMVGGGGVTNNYYFSTPAIDAKSFRHEWRYGKLGREFARAVAR